MQEIPDVATMLRPPLVANVYRFNPRCGRCHGPAVCIVATIADASAHAITLLTVCEPCADMIIAALNVTSIKNGPTWIRKGDEIVVPETKA